MPFCDPLASDRPEKVENPGWWVWGVWAAAALAWWCSVYEKVHPDIPY